MSESVDSLKQRLVGAFVILSLAVIFLPMLFDKPHREENAAVELVPPKPRVETVVIAKPKPLSAQQVVSDPAPSGEMNIDSAAVGDNSGQGNYKEAQTDAEKPRLVPVTVPVNTAVANLSDGNTEPVTKTDSAKSLKSTSNPSSKSSPKVYSNVWMVQLGTFSKSENAYKLRDKLRASGVDGHTKPIDSGKAIRVFAGPFVTKKEALRIKRKVDAEFKIESLVVFFEA